MDVQSLNIVHAILEPGVFGIPVLDVVIGTSLVVMLIYFWLSTHLIDFYAGLVQRLHHHMRWLVALLLVAMVGVDLQFAQVGLIKYFILLSGFTAFGFLLKQFRISAIPFLFALILADKIIWLSIQAAAIYF